MTGLAGGGFLTVFFLREIPMHTTTDERYGLRREVDTSHAESTPDEQDRERGHKPLEMEIAMASSSLQAITEKDAPSVA